ncbi:hypothetical protein BJY21_001871 [Kineosphaera limosa]|uniref:Ricin B lectin domain-containing protein n=1 Tax=Kineosphaera limosa NBRC 100340 TaxID=1184609 RepID=K6WSF7_9MICO|nr:RICIN domain-containing protein [Kineosphaera limosa]NYE00687.1 hypothetical protein [Kineosphaera limosa]GAB96776.1 hypothetical protein KILIM_048_00140 [Kineosphaera limosa NBRC 100340]
MPSTDRRSTRHTIAMSAAVVAVGAGLLAGPIDAATAAMPAATASTRTARTATTSTAATMTSAAFPLPAGPGDPIRPRPVLPKEISPAIRALFHRHELINTASKLRADVIWASTAPLTGVFLWPDNASRSQEFYKLSSGDGWFRLKARHSDQCLMLDWRGGTYTNGTKVLQHPYCGDGYTPSQWKLVQLDRYKEPCRNGPPNYCGFVIPKTVLVNRRTGRCLDAHNPRLGTPGAQAVLQQWDCARYLDDPKIGNQAWGLLDLDAPKPKPPVIH